MREHETELFSSSRIFGGNNRTVRLSRRFFSKLHADMVWGCLPSHINDLSIGKKTENEGQNNTGDCRCDKYDHVWWSVSREKCNASLINYLNLCSKKRVDSYCHAQVT